MSDRFWNSMDELVATSQIKIDRPRGSRHPLVHEAVLPVDYGYLEGTTSGGGDGVDVWLGSRPDRGLDAVICTVDLHKRDVEVKLLLGCTEQEKASIMEFHSNPVLVMRPAESD